MSGSQFVNPYNFIPLALDSQILKNFRTMTGFDAVKGKNVSYPLAGKRDKNGNMNIFDWFPQNHAGHRVKDGQKIPLKTPNSRKRMAFVEYMEPMTPEPKPTGYRKQAISGSHRNNGESQGGKGRKAGKDKRWQQALRENLRLTLEEMTIIIVAWISRRQKIGSKKGEDRNFRELRAKMGFESQRLCGIQNWSVEMGESRSRELLHPTCSPMRHTPHIRRNGSIPIKGIVTVFSSCSPFG